MKFVPAAPPTVQPVGKATKFVAAAPPTVHPEYLFGKLMTPLVRSIVTVNDAALVKLHVKFAARALPAASFAAVVMVAVYCVSPARAAEGVKVAVLPLMLTDPATAAPSDVRLNVKLVVLRVEPVMASEKVALTVLVVATALAPLEGEVDETVGGVVSAAPPSPG